MKYYWKIGRSGRKRVVGNWNNDMKYPGYYFLMSECLKDDFISDFWAEFIRRQDITHR